MIDAHSGVLGAGAIEQGEFTAVIGTSTCHLMLDPKQEPIPAITGSVKMLLYPVYMPMKQAKPQLVIYLVTQNNWLQSQLQILLLKIMSLT